MATFSQWMAKKPLRRLSWVCGPEPCLTAEVVRAYREAVSGSALVLIAGCVDETELWDQVLTCPPDSGRLIIVLAAEKLRRLDSLAVLAEAGGMDTAFTVFVSSDPDFARDEAGSKKVLAPHLAAVQACKGGQLIRCVAPSDEEKLFVLVASWWPGAGANLAYELLQRCGGVLALAREACLKAELAGLEPTSDSARIVADSMPAADFVTAVISGDSRAAAVSAGQLSPSDIGYSLAVLASRLGHLALLKEAKDRGMTAQEIAAKLHVERFLQRELGPYAPRYGPEKVRSCREVLALAESAWRSGATVGVPEIVAALW
jgi:hypothetical protein